MKIVIIIGSTREGRAGPRVAEWVASTIKSQHEVTILDLASYQLPFYDSPKPPSELSGEYPYEQVGRWSADITKAEAVIFIAPEYNHGIAAPLKNAIDWLWNEWQDKPAAIVSYSNGIGGGLRGAEQLKLILSAVGMRLTQFHASIGSVHPDIPETAKEPISKQLHSIVKSLEKLGN